MNKRNVFHGLLFTCLLVVACTPTRKTTLHEREEAQSGAGIALDFWAFSRAYPDSTIRVDKFAQAFESKQMAYATEGGGEPSLPAWRSIGPKNIGGRTLCMAFDPTNARTVWIGSASGGLWKSTTAGEGTQAWQKVETGFPVLGVSSIAIAPDGKTMYIGTGEVYNYQNAGTGYAFRIFRGTYGIGILKSTDGGATWSKSLDWQYADLRGVWKVVINPRNPNTVFAATTEGVYRSYDAGKNWTLVNATKMAVDLDVHASDTSRLYATFGSINNAINGIYRSDNGGTTWSKLTAGLPGSYSGKSMLSINPTSPNELWVSVANNFNQIGLFKSTNFGDSWNIVNDNDVAFFQGWYSHDVAISPTNPNLVFHVGIDAHRSDDGGASFNQVSSWSSWYLGVVPVGGPEGPPNYIHADIHEVQFHPTNPNQIWFATDGGIFVSYDNGNTFAGRNGGYQTAQFYANFSNSQQDSLFAIGGMQDNMTAVYDGRDAWRKVIGGDGMCTAIHPLNDSILFASYQTLNVFRSTDRGFSFSGITFELSNDVPAFNAPYEIAPSNPNVMYAGSSVFLKSDNGGRSFFIPNRNWTDDGNPITTMAVSPFNEKTVVFATAPTVRPGARLYKTTDAGLTFQRLQGLPDRLVNDVVFHPKDSNRLYAVLSGFNTQHLYKSDDAGQTWAAFGQGLPDVPTNALLIDPQQPEFMYIGNDLGVYFSADSGTTWKPYKNGLPEVCLAMHLSHTAAGRKMRVATHGNGVFEARFLTRNDLLVPTDSVSVAVQMEETGVELKNVDYFLLSRNTGDTLTRAKTNSGTRLGMPNGLTAPLYTAPQYPFPHPQNATLQDSLYPFWLAAAKNDDALNGVSTFDLALISRHLLDIQRFGSPYKYLAADVDHSGEIDARDMLFLRRYILRVEEPFKTYLPWLLLPKYTSLPSEPNGNQLLQKYYFNAYSSKNPESFEFTAVKMGDVNSSVVLFAKNETQTRNAPLAFAAENAFLEKGQEHELALRWPKDASFMTLQAGLRAAGIEVLDVYAEKLPRFDRENHHFIAEKGELRVSWSDVYDNAFKQGESALVIKIKAKQAGFLKDFLRTDDAVLANELVNEKGLVTPLTINWVEKVSGDKLFQNQPNPFTNETTVRFDVDTEGPVKFTLFDETGKILLQNAQSYKRGQHLLRLNAQELSLPKGTLLLQMESLNQKQTIKIQNF